MLLHTCACLVLTAAALPTDRTVPGQFPTIQGAIVAASDGDTITVSPGTYVENLDYMGKEVVIRSTDGPDVTIIDGNQQGTVVRFTVHLGSAARLEGFTIQNGLGTLNPTTLDLEAGGITCDRASPGIVDCIIQNNEGASWFAGCPHVDAGCGGVGYSGSNFFDVPSLERCVIFGNRGGGGIAPDDSLSAGVGGISAEGISPVIRDCVIRENFGGKAAASPFAVDSGTGGIVLHSSTHLDGPLVVDSLIEGNVGGSNVTPSGDAGDGGIYINSTTARVDRCTIRNNIGGDELGSGNGRGGVGGIYARSVRPGCEITSCLVVGNRGGDAGPDSGDTGGAGGIRVRTNALAITNCTLTANIGGAGTTSGAGGFQCSTSTGERVRIMNSIMWGNVGSGAGDPDYRFDDPPPPIIMYSIVGSSGSGGPGGNFGADPEFRDAAGGDFHLACGSPAIDVGTREEPTVPNRDLDGDFRLIGEGVDIGADEVRVPDASPYCIATANSSGIPASISARGCASVADNSFTIVAEGIPGTPGLFFYGHNQIQMPFVDGFRCVGGAVRRLPPSQSTGGLLTRTLDLTVTPITGGSTWNFQAWYRDGAAGGAGSNLTGGLEVSFEP